MKKTWMTMIMAIVLIGSMVAVSQAESGPKIIAAKFHADWCGSCKTLGPVLKGVEEKYRAKDVLFVKFDKTDDGTSHQSELLAASLGLSKAYQANPKTGFVLLANANTKEVVGKLTKTQSAVEMASVLDRVLAGEKVIDAAMDSGSTMKGSDKGSSMHKGSGKMKGSGY